MIVRLLGERHAVVQGRRSWGRCRGFPSGATCRLKLAGWVNSVGNAETYIMRRLKNEMINIMAQLGMALKTQKK